MVEGVRSPIEVTNDSKRLVNLGSPEHISRGGECRGGHIAVVPAHQQVTAVRTYVPNCKRQIREYLALDVEVPLLHVIAVGGVLHDRCAEFSRLDSCGRIDQ